MQQSGAGWVVYGDDVESLAFDWGTVKIFSEPAVTQAERFSFGMVVSPVRAAWAAVRSGVSQTSAQG